MNIINVIEELEKTDPEVYDRLNPRRDALKSFTRLGGRVALTALPFALGAYFKKAYASPPATSKVIEVLNYALGLEHLEANFYIQGYAASFYPTTAAKTAIGTIRDHENAHVTFLTNAIKSLGGTPVTKANYDFSGGKGTGTGPFANVFTNYETFLAVAQTFEDTGVRAYKGRAAELVEGGDLLTAALNIHSVEARHASHIRQMRKANGFGTGDVKPWITGNSSNINSTAVQPSYNGEDNTIQATIQITNIGGQATVTADRASEAFDEGLSATDVAAIVSNFIAP